ncbi:MAG: Fur family transcriptional regulator [Rectinemataceae bacterium]
MVTDEKMVLEHYLRTRGLKMTASRETVLRAFLKNEGHMTTEDIFAASRRLDPGIGQATVFRTVKLLSEAGLAREACQDSGARSYEHAFKHRHHDHLQCVECGKIVEFFDPAIERAQEAVFRQHGFAATGHKMELLGLCPDCANRAARIGTAGDIR